MPPGWLNLEGATDSQLFEQDSAFSFLGLTRTQRLYGFIGCLAIGFALSLLGTLLLITGALTLFAIFYGIGTIISLVGTGFLIGFGNQIKQMFKPVRVVATLLLLVSIGMIFVGAFVIGNGILCIIFVVIQYLAYIWYCLSYIPYARAGVKKLFGMS